MTTADSNGSDSWAVGRALLLLRVVCEQGTITMAAAAREADLPPSTALRLLRKLESSGFVQRDDQNKYSPGPTLIGLGAQALNRSEIVRNARPIMGAFAVETGESVYLSVKRPDDYCIYIASAQGTQPVRYENWVGRTFHVDNSAAGAVLVGESDPMGFVVKTETVAPDVTAIAAPLIVDGQTVAALSALIPSYRLNAETTFNLGRSLVDATERIGRTGISGRSAGDDAVDKVTP